MGLTFVDIIIIKSYNVISLVQSVQDLERLESELLLEMKKVNGALEKQPREPVGAHFVKVSGLRYDTINGAVGGNTIDVLILVSVGDKYPADLVVSQRIKNPFLAEQATRTFGSLPLLVPGLHKEAAADLMASASIRMKSANTSVVQILIDVPMMQRSKQFYLKKIETFLQNCQEPVGMCVDY